MKLFLTAGHHFKDSGAVANGYQENLLNIEIRDLVVAELKKRFPGIEVWTDSDSKTLAQVILEVKAQATANDIWIEFHFDSAERIAASGTTALVANNAREKSRLIAADLALVGSQTLAIPNRGVRTESESNRGKLGMLHTAASSVLLEVGFVSNIGDMVSFQKQKHCLAEVYANKIAKYFNHGN